MYKNKIKRVRSTRICLIILLLLLFVGVGYANEFSNDTIPSDDSYRSFDDAGPSRDSYRPNNDAIPSDDSYRPHGETNQSDDRSNEFNKEEFKPYNPQFNNQYEKQQTFAEKPETKHEVLAQPIHYKTPISYSLSRDGKELFIFDIKSMEKLQTYILEEQLNLLRINLSNKLKPEESTFLILNYLDKLVVHNIRNTKQTSFGGFKGLRAKKIDFYENNLDKELHLIYNYKKNLIYKRFNKDLDLVNHSKCKVFKKNYRDTKRSIHKLLLTDSNEVVVTYTNIKNNENFILKCQIMGSKIKNIQKLPLDGEFFTIHAMYTEDTKGRTFIITTNTTVETTNRINMYAWNSNRFWNRRFLLPKPYTLKGQMRLKPQLFVNRSYTKENCYDSYLSLISESGNRAYLSYYQLDTTKNGKNVFILQNSETINVQDTDIFFNFISPYGTFSNYFILSSSNISIFKNELDIENKWQLNSSPFFVSDSFQHRNKFFVKTNPHLFSFNNSKDYRLLFITEAMPENAEENIYESWYLKIRLGKTIEQPEKIEF